jgi:hypothetical protein
MSKRASSCLTSKDTVGLHRPALPQPQPVPTEQYLLDGAEHPDLPLSLLRNIEASHPLLTTLDLQCCAHFEEAGCRILARALLLNSRITALSLADTKIAAEGAAVLFPALAHLTTLSSLSLTGTHLQSSGAGHLCSALGRLTALTELFLYSSQLTADDGARICGVAAAAAVTRLKTLSLGGNGFYVTDVVGCGTWRRARLPQPPVDFEQKCGSIFSWSAEPLVSFLVREDDAAFNLAVSLEGSGSYGPASLLYHQRFQTRLFLLGAHPRTCHAQLARDACCGKLLRGYVVALSLCCLPPPLLHVNPRWFGRSALHSERRRAKCGGAVGVLVRRLTLCVTSLHPAPPARRQRLITAVLSRVAAARGAGS